MNIDSLRAAMRTALDNREAEQVRADGVVSAAEQRGDDHLTDDETATLAEARSALDALDAEIEALEADINAAEVSERSRQRAAELRAKMPALIIPSEGPESRSAFDRFVAGETRSFTATPETRDMTVADATGAGNTVPTTIYGQVITAIRDQSPIANLANVINTTSGETINVPTVSPLTMEAVGEAAAIPESDPTSALIPLTVSKYGRLVQFSTELLSDSAINWQSWLSEQAGLAVGADYGADLSADVLAGTTAGATAGAISADGLIDLFYSVHQSYRNNGAFVTNSVTAADIRKLAGSDGVGLWTAPLSAGQPSTLLGRPFLTDDTITTDGAVMFGDFGRGVISRFAGGVRLDRSDDYAFGNDLVTWRLLVRAGSAVVNPAAIKKLLPA